MLRCFLLGLLLAFAVSRLAPQTPPASHFDGKSWWAHVKFLADDALAGRNTGSEGLRKAEAYAVEQLEKAGLEPAGVNGFYQPVHFTQFQVDESKSSLALVSKGKAAPLSFADDAFISSRSTRATVSLEAPLVFVGYGLKIPEKNLDELAGLDLIGKVVVYLAGSPADIPSALASNYQTAGERWKSLDAAGVAGVITIFNPASMDIPWSRISANRNEPSMDLAGSEFNETPGQQLGVAFNPASAEKLFANSGHTFAEIAELGKDRKTLPHFPLAVSLNARAFIQTAPVESSNLVAKLPGSDPALKDEFVVLSAHIDHMGIRPIADPEPLRNRFIRSDQYSFIKKGVPSAKVDVGFELGTPEQKIFKDWLTNRYHAPSDDVNQPVDLETAAGYEEFTRRLLLEAANTSARPQWKADSFFRRYAAD